MDDVVELKRSCTFLSVSLKKFHEHLHLDLKPVTHSIHFIFINSFHEKTFKKKILFSKRQSVEGPNIHYEVCKKFKDMVQKD
uniref:Uncharacterized protein n=1 Tax=Lepeophtheirus salmonis TaxID=72036 RepID=A0A0K2U6J4_LEPSM